VLVKAGVCGHLSGCAATFAVSLCETALQATWQEGAVQQQARDECGQVVGATTAGTRCICLLVYQPKFLPGITNKLHHFNCSSAAVLVACWFSKDWVARCISWP